MTQLTYCNIVRRPTGQHNLTCITRKQTLRSLSLSYQKKDGKFSGQQHKKQIVKDSHSAPYVNFERCPSCSSLSCTSYVVFCLYFNCLSTQVYMLYITHFVWVLYRQVILGGLKEYHSLKNEARVASDLPPLTEDTHEVCKHMRAASPPASAADLIEQQQMPNRGPKRTRRVSDSHEALLNGTKIRI